MNEAESGRSEGCRKARFRAEAAVGQFRKGGCNRRGADVDFTVARCNKRLSGAAQGVDAPLGQYPGLEVRLFSIVENPAPTVSV